MSDRKPNYVSNTTDEMKSPGNNLAFLLEGIAHQRAGGSHSDAILAQEARGQQEVVASSVLPVQGSSGQEERARLEAIGIKLEDVVDGDPLFRYAVLPEGWTKRGTDHAMHSDVLDEKGRKRIGIFYKAAFYDRNAHMRLLPRFGTRAVSVNNDYDPPYVGVVLDSDKEMWRSGECASYDEAIDCASAWLKAQGFTDFRNPALYWE